MDIERRNNRFKKKLLAKRAAIMKNPTQLSFFKIRPDFGGSLLLGKRKEARPLSTKHPLHLILKSEKARGSLSFINHRFALELALSKVASQFKIKIYDKSVNNDHIHMVILFKSKEAYKSFIRVLSAEIVRIISKKTKTPLKDFFTQRPYTKILSWGKQLNITLEYQILNQMEYFGLRPKKKKPNSPHFPLMGRTPIRKARSRTATR
jgi:hypothetical protein